LLKTIPIESLDLDIAEKEEIKYLGVETIHDLQNIPYKALLTRFGPKIIKTLKKSISVEPELRSYFISQSVFSRTIHLPEPISLIPDIIRLYEKLTNALGSHFKKNNKGTRALNLNIHQVDNTKQLIQIKTAEVTSNYKIFIRLFELKLNQVEAGFGIEFIRVSASDIEDPPLFQDKLQISNIKEDRPFRATLQKEEYENLILELSNKIGFDSLIHLHPNQSHIPENNTQRISAAYCSPTFSWPPATHQRPLLIFRPEAIKIIGCKKNS
jgi:protein ImuB